MGSMSLIHWLILAAIVLILFGGRGKISDLMGDVAKGIKSFKKGMADDEPAATQQQPVKTIDAQAGTTVNPTEQTKAG
ncbi:twin-arginine translocase TatA/TatE family subunit [Labrys neptuniae]